MWENQISNGSLYLDKFTKFFIIIDNILILKGCISREDGSGIQRGWIANYISKFHDYVFNRKYSGIDI